VQALAALLFTVNLGWTLLAPKPAAVPKPEAAAARGPATAPATATAAGLARLPAASPAGASAAALGPDSPVGQWVDRKDGALELLVRAGLHPLQDPQHLEMVRRAGIPLSHACNKHGISLASLVERLQALPDRGAGLAGAVLTPDDVIGEMVRRYPPTREVLRRRFGEGCFTCPGFETETLAQGAMMHGVDVDELVDELNVVASADG
jgi:hybrid cluster-associated redox disulfide protein